MRQLSIGITLLLALVAVAAYGQTDGGKAKKKKDNMIGLSGTVADGFTKAPIPDVKVILMREDSTAVDTTKVWEYHSYSSGIGRSPGKTDYNFLVSREPARYILKFEHPNYETAYADFTMKQVSRRQQTVEGPKVYLKKAARADHFEGGDLKEVVVKATKVKMVWRGDTLIYNADAFNVPEGSMLDGLIKQLPGVELKDDGEIFVNGKKIENLTLSGTDFFKGKNKIMLENLPHYTVKNVQVFNKRTPRSEFLGRDMEDKEYTMDVVLKKEYSVGATVNLEAGYGTDNHYKTRGFGLRYTDQTRAVLFGGMNNLNEYIDYDREGNERDRTQASGDRDLKSIGGMFAWHAPEERITDNLEFRLNWQDSHTESESSSENFLAGKSTFGQSRSASNYRPFSLSARNTFYIRKPIYVYSWINFEYNRGNNNGESWSLTANDQLMKDSVNQTWSIYSSKNNSLRLNWQTNGEFKMPWGDELELDVDLNWNRQWGDGSFSQNRYTLFNTGTVDQRNQYTYSPYKNYGINGQLAYRL